MFYGFEMNSQKFFHEEVTELLRKLTLRKALLKLTAVSYNASLLYEINSKDIFYQNIK